MHETPASRPRVLVVEDEPDTRAMTVAARFTGNEVQLHCVRVRS